MLPPSIISEVGLPKDLGILLRTLKTLGTMHVNTMYNNVVICAESCRKKRSTANRGPLSEERYDLLVAAIWGNPDKIPEVDGFIKQNTSYMYSGSCKSKPNFCYDEGSGTLYRLTSEGRREVVHANRAREI